MPDTKSYQIAIIWTDGLTTGWSADYADEGNATEDVKRFTSRGGSSRTVLVATVCETRTQNARTLSIEDPPRTEERGERVNKDYYVAIIWSDGQFEGWTSDRRTSREAVIEEIRERARLEKPRRAALHAAICPVGTLEAELITLS